MLKEGLICLLRFLENSEVLSLIRSVLTFNHCYRSTVLKATAVISLTHFRCLVVWCLRHILAFYSEICVEVKVGMCKAGGRIFFIHFFVICTLLIWHIYIYVYIHTHTHSRIYIYIYIYIYINCILSFEAIGLH
jgi:hypothetical protein